MPAHSGKFPVLLFVSFAVMINFIEPKMRVGLGDNKIFATFMPMPKTTIDKNTCAVFSQNNIWMSWQSRIVKPIAETLAPQIFANKISGFVFAERIEAMFL